MLQQAEFQNRMTWPSSRRSWAIGLPALFGSSRKIQWRRKVRRRHPRFLSRLKYRTDDKLAHSVEANPVHLGKLHRPKWQAQSQAVAVRWTCHQAPINPGHCSESGPHLCWPYSHKAQWLNLPNPKARNSPEAIGTSATRLKLQSCYEVAKLEDQARSREFGHFVSTRCFNRNGSYTYRRTSSWAHSYMSWRLNGTSANMESKHDRGRKTVKVRTHVPLTRGL